MIRGQSICFLGIITIYFFCLSPFPNTFASSPTRSLCRRDQRDVLLELQKEFPIHNITVSSWNHSVDCCTWDGVTCDTILGVVISFYISSSTTVNMNLKSSSALFKLQHLTYLNLASCNLQGVIPSSIGNLSNLTIFDISGNHLVGEIPASLGNLNQLRIMDLSDNDLNGNIPTSFANLTKLSQLNLRGNQFTGGMDLVLPKLTGLSNLYLSSNHFQPSIFSNVSTLHKLEDFYGSDNSFVGSFPSSLLTISSLVNLDLSHNNFGGQVPKSISKLSNLGMLDLSHNKLEGQVPQCLWRSSKLYNVDLSHNSFSTFGDSVEVLDEASLRDLILASNSFQSSVPQWICKLSFLSTLDLSNNLFNGSIPGCLSHIFRLESLNLRNNSLSGFIPSVDSYCSLGFLDLSRNNFVGKLPKSLRNCTQMQFLNVKGNKIKDTFPLWLGSLQNLNVLVLGANAFYGPVYNPSAYLGFPGLRIIDISNNNFYGSLPQDYFASWPEMSSVWIGDEDYPNTNYMGSGYFEYTSTDLVYKGVHTDFARIFKAFKAIDFSGNRFSGNIPKSIGLLSDLRLLNLSGNIFTGNIPQSLANITKLEVLDLSQNNLSGEIPQDLGKLMFLSNINFSYNHLQGLVPQSTQFGSQNCFSFLGNPKLHGFEETCGEIHHVPIPTSQQPEESLSEPEEKIVNWIAVAIAFGPGVFCGLVIGHIFTFYKYEWLRAKLC